MVQGIVIIISFETKTNIVTITETGLQTGCRFEKMQASIHTTTTNAIYD